MSAREMEATIRFTKNDTLKRVYRKFLLLIAMGVVASTIGAVFDTIIAGNAIGEQAVAAISLASPVYLLSTMLYMIFSVGGGTTCSQMIGAGQTDMTAALFSIALGIGLLIAFVLIVVGVPASTAIAVAMGGSTPEIVRLASTYINGTLYSLPFVVLCHVTMTFVSIDGSPNISFLSTAVTAVAKLIADIIFVKCGLGIMGVALSTAVSFFIGFLVLLPHWKKDYCTLKFVNFFKHLGLLGRMIKTGLPNALGFLWQAVHSILCNKVLISLAGTVALAGASVSSTLSQLLMVMVMSFGYTLSSVLGLFFGEKDERAMSDVFNFAVRWGLMLNIAVGVVTFVFAGKFAAIFGVKDPIALEIAYISTLVLAITFPLSVMQYNLLYTYQCTGHTSLANLIVFGKSVLFYLPFLYGLSGRFGIKGALAANLFGEALCLVAVYAIVYYKTGKNPFRTPNVFLLPASFNEKHIYADVSVSYTQTSLARFKAELAKRVEPEIVDKAITACSNIIAHQPQEAKDKSMDVFITRQGEDGSIKIRYQGAPYNAGAKIEGTQFRYTLGMNTITIKLLNTPFNPKEVEA